MKRAVAFLGYISFFLLALAQVSCKKTYPVSPFSGTYIGFDTIIPTSGTITPVIVRDTVVITAGLNYLKQNSIGINFKASGISAGAITNGDTCYTYFQQSPTKDL